jgi:UDPglucose--hexose-1-phosphate uridylyltransferase
MPEQTMPELRYNLITGEWVIVAEERARRPEDFARAKQQRAPREHSPTCPFCPGNEANTPGTTLSLPADGPWLVRSVPNRYPALSPDGGAERCGAGYHQMVEGTGRHEVIIESPAHGSSLALLPVEHVALVLEAYRERTRAFYADPRIEHVIIFRNHGAGAGTSLEHPHSQVVGTPVVPGQVRTRLEEALRFFGDSGRCVFCHCLEEELTDASRIVAANPGFVAFVPFAALSPFHLWIFPRRHLAYFGDVEDGELAELAAILKETLLRLRGLLGDPDFNLVVRSVSPSEHLVRYFHWYVSIVPRLSNAAGFELGTGMFINTVQPEASARQLREAGFPSHGSGRSEGPP